MINNQLQFNLCIIQESDGLFQFEIGANNAVDNFANYNAINCKSNYVNGNANELAY